MKNTKKQIFIFTISIIVLSSVILMSSFNLVMQNYIKSEAIKTITKKMNVYKSESGNVTFDTTESIKDSVPVNNILLTLNYEPFVKIISFYSENKIMEDKIIEYCKQNPRTDEEIQFVSINNEDFYIAQTHLKTIYYNSTEANINENAINIEETENAGLKKEEEEDILILYSRVTPLSILSKSINIVFLVILLVFTILSGFLGIRIGKQIENSQKKLKEFFQNVSHELKTPIMSIQGYAEGIQTKVIEDQSKAIEIIINESDKMSDLVEELLYISKIDSGQLTVKKEPIAINELLYDCSKSIEMIAKNKGIEINFNFDEISPIIYGDEKQLSKAFTNILINAVKYAKSEVSIKCNKHKKYIEIFFCDDGDGINEKDLSHVFERFYKGKNGNTGIGLALTKEIIDIHKGKLTAGNLHKGAVFKVIL
ncbi:two-component sensor histidine kinase [Clostridium gelidum]|uniref:histidine kinase n=1 Tax=Clostridium gelidum TaxID=704125 RepID=A0ABN6IYW6_9CLOT|nr:HAMP domain-containing sensor histidine kinase [Clostridium gelidum]BCZ47314.1 two-component sensor histidine kinase [Clostridium gelidum]